MSDDATLSLAKFGAWCIGQLRGDYIGDDINGGDAQDEMERIGLLEKVHVIEPCGEHCSCAEYDDFPQDCLRLRAGVMAAIGELGP